MSHGQVLGKAGLVSHGQVLGIACPSSFPVAKRRLKKVVVAAGADTCCQVPTNCTFLQNGEVGSESVSFLGKDEAHTF